MMMCGCGITKVHFLGLPDDWTSLKSKIVKMGEYDSTLEKWAVLLIEIIDKFIEQMTGKVDRVFWNQIICKELGYESGPSGYGRTEADLMTGWLAVFLFLS